MMHYTKEDMRLISFELPEKLLDDFENTVNRLNGNYNALLVEAIEDLIKKHEKDIDPNVKIKEVSK